MSIVLLKLDQAQDMVSWNDEDKKSACRCLGPERR